MTHRVLEVCYDLSRIPGCNPANPHDPRALRFRDSAAHFVEAAMVDAGLGACVGAEASSGEVSFRLAVTDFDAAEAEVWHAVEASPYAAIREILRYWDADAAA